MFLRKSSASFSIWGFFNGKLKHFSIECGSNYAIALVSFGLGELYHQSDTELKPIIELQFSHSYFFALGASYLSSF